MAFLRENGFFKEKMRDIRAKEVGYLTAACATSFGIGYYTEDLRSKGVIDTKTKWTIVGATSALILLTCGAQHYNTLRRCLRVSGDILETE